MPDGHITDLLGPLRQMNKEWTDGVPLRNPIQDALKRLLPMRCQTMVKHRSFERYDSMPYHCQDVMMRGEMGCCVLSELNDESRRCGREQ